MIYGETPFFTQSGKDSKFSFMPNVPHNEVEKLVQILMLGRHIHFWIGNSKNISWGKAKLEQSDATTFHIEGLEKALRVIHLVRTQAGGRGFSPSMILILNMWRMFYKF